MKRLFALILPFSICGSIAAASPVLEDFLRGFVPVETHHITSDGQIVCEIEGYQMFEFRFSSGRIIYSSSNSMIIGSEDGGLKTRFADAVVICQNRKFVRVIR